MRPNCLFSQASTADGACSYALNGVPSAQLLQQQQISHFGGRRLVCGAAKGLKGRSFSVRTQAATAEASSATPIGVGEIVDVEDVDGIRVLIGENNMPMIEYLVRWKDGATPTWEPVENLSDNLVRDFEEKWWKACREGDEETIQRMLEHSREVLPQCVDSNNRSALHFVAALGKTSCCQLLCEAGADVDYPDKDGYTPLHMAVGYSHVSTVKTLLDAGANPEVPDNQGRNVVQLVDSIRDQMPISPQLAGKRIALEEVSGLLTGNLFEEVYPRRILEERTAANGSKEYLVQWLDGADDSWVKEGDVAKDVIEDFEKGYEYAEALQLLKMKRRGDAILYLVRWADGTPDSWENEDNLSPQLIKAFEESRQGGGSQTALLPDLPEGAKPKKRKTRRRRNPKARSERLGGSRGGESRGAVSVSGNGKEDSQAHAGVSNGKDGRVERQQEPVAA